MFFTRLTRGDEAALGLLLQYFEFGTIWRKVHSDSGSFQPSTWCYIWHDFDTRTSKFHPATGFNLMRNIIPKGFWPQKQFRTSRSAAVLNRALWFSASVSQWLCDMIGICKRWTSLKTGASAGIIHWTLSERFLIKTSEHWHLQVNTPSSKSMRGSHQVLSRTRGDNLVYLSEREHVFYLSVSLLLLDHLY